MKNPLAGRPADFLIQIHLGVFAAKREFRVSEINYRCAFLPSAGGFIFQKKIDSLYSSERLNHSLSHAILCKESILESDNGEGELGLL